MNQGLPPTAGYGSYGGYGGYSPAYPPARPTNGLAIGALVTSIVGFFLIICYGIGGLAGLVGAILGHVARRQIRERGDAGAGMALTGVIVGWITVGLTVAVIALFVVLITTGSLDNTSSTDFDSFDAFRMIIST